MSALCLMMALAGAQELNLDVRPARAGGAHVDLGEVNTRVGQPPTGERVRTAGGAHFVVPMRVSVRRTHRVGAQEPAGASFRRSRMATLATPGFTEVDIFLRAELASTGPGLEARLGVGRRTDWSAAPDAGRAIRGDTFVSTVDSDGTRIHEVSLYVPDEAWGPQRVVLFYTAVPR